VATALSPHLTRNLNMVGLPPPETPPDRHRSFRPPTATIVALGRRGQLEDTRRQGLHLFLGVLAISLIPLGVQTLTPMRDARWMTGLMGFLRHGGTPLFLLLWSASCLALLIRKKTRGEVGLEGLVALAPNLDGLGLTEREREVAARLLQRHSYREIAQALFISVSTVQSHAHRIYRKAGVAGRREFIAKASH
jgi:DNA-binding CsgD family transcriptional regulator